MSFKCNLGHEHISTNSAVDCEQRATLLRGDFFVTDETIFSLDDIRTVVILGTTGRDCLDTIRIRYTDDSSVDIRFPNREVTYRIFSEIEKRLIGKEK